MCLLRSTAVHILHPRLDLPLLPPRFLPFMTISRFKTLACLFLALGNAGCRGGTGRIAMDDALDISAVAISAPGGQVRIHAVAPGSGVSGEHALAGAGAKDRASVTLDEDGVLRIDATCLPLAPCRLDLDLAVPETMPVAIDLGAGDVFTSGVFEVDALVHRGDVSIIDGYNATVRVGEGDLHVRLAGPGTLRAVLAAGDAEIAVQPGGWQIQAVAADLKMTGVSLDRLASRALDVHAPGGTVLLLGLEELAVR